MLFGLFHTEYNPLLPSEISNSWLPKALMMRIFSNCLSRIIPEKLGAQSCPKVYPPNCFAFLCSNPYKYVFV